MDIKSFVEKAKEAALAAAEQAKAAAASGQAMNFAALTAEKLGEFKDLGSETIQALMASFQQALPAIAMAGYELTEFEVELGVTPKLIPHFRHVDKSAEEIAGARASVRENKLGALLLGGLLKAGEVHKQINVAGFGFSHVEIELGLIPSVRLQYKSDGPDAAGPRVALPPPDTAETTDAAVRSSD